MYAVRRLPRGIHYRGNVEDIQSLFPRPSKRDASGEGRGLRGTLNQEHLTLQDSDADKDFRLGLNATQTTLAAVAQLVNASVKTSVKR